jgi:hypothetical protein
VFGHRGDKYIYTKCTRRALLGIRTGCSKGLSTLCRKLWRLHLINKRKSVRLRLHVLDIHLPKWIRPLAFRPSTETVHAASDQCPKQTPTNHNRLELIIIEIDIVTIILK